MTTNDTPPKWDVALASLAMDEYKKKTAPLTMDDFHNLASQHAIRLDDIMETMFLLVIHSQWIYTDSNGQQQSLDQETLDGLYVKRRLSDADLAAFDGDWRPE
jgi:hypothetical protein